MKVMYTSKYRRLAKATFFLVFLLTGAITSYAQLDSKGTDFWLMFDGNPYSNPPTTTLYITSQVNTSGTVTVPGLSVSTPFTVTANTVTPVTVPNSTATHTSGTIDNLGIHVTSVNDVTIYGLNDAPYTADGYLGLPTDVLGTNYIVLTYGGGGGALLGIVGTVNATTVTITPSAAVSGHSAGVPYTITLNQGQTYELTSSGDLTGSLISSTSPVGVMGANYCANIPNSASYCDHICEMLPPVNTYGVHFGIVPLKGRVNGDTWRFMASTNNTVVTINGVAQPAINSGQFVEKLITANSYVTSDKPILAAQYANGASLSGDPGDPFEMVVPPLEQFLAHYTVINVTGFTAQYVNVVAPTSVAGSITFDGTAIPAASYTAIGTSGYSGAQITTTTGSHTLDGSLPFGVFVYGFNNDDSYGYTGGQSFSPVASVTSLALTPASGSANVNTQQCFTAHVTDQNNNPLSGILVNFAVTGANSTNGFATTNASGNAQFCYTGTNGGADNIHATAANLSANSTFSWTVCAPTFTTCPGNATQPSDIGVCTAAVAYTTTATAPAGYPVSYTYAYTNATSASGSGTGTGSAFNYGSTHVVVTAATSCGTATCAFNVTVTDTAHPILNLPANATVNSQDPTTVAALGSATATDNCSVQGAVTYSDASTKDSNPNNTGYYNYTITRTWSATDIHGLSSTGNQIITVHDVTAPVVTPPAAVAQCNNGTNTISQTVTATDAASSPLTYSYAITGTTTGSGSGATATANYAVGTSTITWTVTDVSGNVNNTTTTAVTIYALPTISIASTTNPACNGQSTGSITTTTTGGTPGYNYLWTPGGQTTANRTNIPAGTYAVTVSDSHGCTGSASAALTQPAVLTGLVTGTYAVPSCPAYNVYLGYGPQSITLTTTPGGGTTPYSYNWTPVTGISSTHAVSTSVTPAATTTYTQTVTDAHGCTSAATYQIKVLDIHCGPTYVGRERNNTITMCHNGASVCVSPTLAATYISSNNECLGPCPGAAKHSAGNTTLTEGDITGLISVYPNPTHTTVNIGLSGIGSYYQAFQVMDLTGKVVAQQIAEEGVAGELITIDVANYAPGVYLIRVVGKDHTAISRFTVD